MQDQCWLLCQDGRDVALLHVIDSLDLESQEAEEKK